MLTLAAGAHVPLHWTGSENVRVSVVVPTAPAADASVGGVVSGAVAVAWRACGDEAGLPAASVMLVFVEPTFAFRVVSTNAPLGIAVVSVRIAVVTPLSRAALQTGMLSPVTVSSVVADTFWTFQSAAVNTAAR